MKERSSTSLAALANASAFLSAASRLRLAAASFGVSPLLGLDRYSIPRGFGQDPFEWSLRVFQVAICRNEITDELYHIRGI